MKSGKCQAISVVCCWGTEEYKFLVAVIHHGAGARRRPAQMKIDGARPNGGFFEPRRAIKLKLLIPPGIRRPNFRRSGDWHSPGSARREQHVHRTGAPGHLVATCNEAINYGRGFGSDLRSKMSAAGRAFAEASEISAMADSSAGLRRTTSNL